MQLVVDKIARSFGINEIFKDISFMIDKGEKTVSYTHLTLPTTSRV